MEKYLHFISLKLLNVKSLIKFTVLFILDILFMIWGFIK